MEGPHIGLGYIQNIEHYLDVEKTREFKGYIRSSAGFVPISTSTIDDSVVINGKAIKALRISALTPNGNKVIITSKAILHPVEKPLEEQNILQAIKLAIYAAKKVEGFEYHPSCLLRFNPNIISLDVGRLQWDISRHEFEREFGELAENLQRRLFLGGSVAYARVFDLYAIYFCTKENLKQELLSGLRDIIFPQTTFELKFEGTAQPVNSLDELLQRLEQK